VHGGRLWVESSGAPSQGGEAEEKR
jgi:hypothetical protein